MKVLVAPLIILILSLVLIATAIAFDLGADCNEASDPGSCAELQHNQKAVW